MISSYATQLRVLDSCHFSRKQKDKTGNAQLAAYVFSACCIPRLCANGRNPRRQANRPDSGTVLTGQIILIRDGKIEAVGNNPTVPPNAKIIDLGKLTVLPGLIDCHTQVASGAYDSKDLDVFRKTSAQFVLVQPEMEGRRSPLVSIPPVGRGFSRHRYDHQATPRHGCVPP